MEFVEIRKTPERLRDRRIAIVLSVIASVSSLLMLFLWRMEFTLETPFMTELESMSFLEIAAVSSYGTWIYILIVLAVVASVFGILSSLVAAYSATIVMVVSVLSSLLCDPILRSGGYPRGLFGIGTRPALHPRLHIVRYRCCRVTGRGLRREVGVHGSQDPR